MSWCIDCGEDFRYDDCGGYNPPCSCGAHCRSCHDAATREEAEWDDPRDGEMETMGTGVCGKNATSNEVEDLPHTAVSIPATGAGNG